MSNLHQPNIVTKALTTDDKELLHNNKRKIQKNKSKRAVALRAVEKAPTGSCIGGITIVAETVTVTNHFNF